jgi:hypothetical protein
MDKQTVPTKEKKNFSIKRVIVALAIVIPVVTTILFGYLYLTDTNESDIDTTIDPVVLDDTEIDDEQEVQTAVCVFEEIEAGALRDTNRVKYDYKLILDPDTQSDHPLCEDILKSRIKDILDKQVGVLYESDDVEDIKREVDNGNISYLIDDDFVVNHIWELLRVDLVEESVETLWEYEGDGNVGVFDISVMSQEDSAKMFFTTSTWGLGGSQDEADLIDGIIESHCESGDLGFWMYDTVTDSITKIAEAEECL